MDTELNAGNYVLVDKNMWVRAKGFEILIQKTDEGVTVAIFDKSFLLCGAMSTAEAFDSDLSLEGNPWVKE